MSTSMDWSEEVRCIKSEELLPIDMLDRAKYAEYLTTYLKQYKTKSYVFNLNSTWGSGKTYFIKRWANSLYQNHPVVYFDSWKFDNNNEPLILILSEIIQQLTALVDDPQQKELKSTLQKSVTKTLKHIAPTLGKGIFKKISGVNWDELAEEDKEGDEKDILNLGSDLTAVSTQALLNLHVEQQKTVEELKENVSEILTSVLVDENTDASKRWSPMYVFIDELDRCRPTFAIEVLEVIKHIFDIPRIMFVIATDTEQLQHSIKAVYGREFDAEKYLMRFFDRSFSLPESELERYIGQLPPTKLLLERIIKSNDLNIFSFDEKDGLDTLGMIFAAFKTDLRSTNQIIARVNSILANHTDEIAVLLLIVFECLRVKGNSFYNKLWAKKVNSNAAGENQLAVYLDNMAVSRDLMIRLDTHPNIRNSIYAMQKGADIALDAGTQLSIPGIITILTREIHPPTSIRIKSNEYTSQVAYFQECISSNPKGISRFKEYVELASHLA